MQERRVFYLLVLSLSVLLSAGCGGSSSTTYTAGDQTPPMVNIVAPVGSITAGPGQPATIEVHSQDESGLSQITLQVTGGVGTLETKLVSGGVADSTLSFQIFLPLNAAALPPILLDAQAVDIHGNIGVSTQVELVVDPAMLITARQGLTAQTLTTGAVNFLEAPTSLAVSPKDGFLYVSDVSGAGVCAPTCIRKVDPATGIVAAGPTFVGMGSIEGIAFDATGDNLYLSVRPDRVVKITWDAAIANYGTPVVCNIPGNLDPAAPYQLAVDATLGILVVDDNTKQLRRLSSCAGLSTTAMSTGFFNAPRGIALGPQGEIYVGDNLADSIYQVDRVTGVPTIFFGNLSSVNQPWGIEWLGGTSNYANSLLVAEVGSRQVSAVTGTGGKTTLAWLYSPPRDIALSGGTAYVLTVPGGGKPGNILKITGF